MHDKEIRCCLKRYLARRVLRFLNASVEKLQLDRHRRALLCERPAIMVQLCETEGTEPGSPRPRDHDGRRPNGIHEVTDGGDGGGPAHRHQPPTERQRCFATRQNGSCLRTRAPPSGQARLPGDLSHWAALIVDPSTPRADGELAISVE